MFQIFMFIVNILIQVVITALLTPKVKYQNKTPAGLEDFKFPTALERPIQYIVGETMMLGPNVTFAQGLRTDPIVQKIDRGWFKSTKHVIIGYKYYLNLQLGIGWGPHVKLLEIWNNDKLSWRGELDGEDAGALGYIDNAELFGGEKSEGGVQGDFSFFSGSQTQVVDPYMESRHPGLLTGYRGLSYLMLKDFYVGNRPAVKNMKMLISRYPVAPNGSTIYSKIGKDGNPAYILYEFMTNTQFGPSIPPSMIDTNSIDYAAQVFHSEGFGLSMVIDGQMPFEDIKNEIQRYTGSVVVEDIITGKLRLKVIRRDYDSSLIPVIDPSMIKSISNFTRGAASEMINEMRLGFEDRERNFERSYVTAQNLGSRFEKGWVDSTTAQFPWIKSAELASRVAAREIYAMSTAVARMSLELNRKAFKLNIGDVAKVNWPEMGIEDMVVRILKVDQGSLANRTIKMEVAEDQFIFNGRATTAVPLRATSSPVYIQDTFGEDVLAVYAPTFFSDDPDTTQVMVMAATNDVTMTSWKLAWGKIDWSLADPYSETRTEGDRSKYTPRGYSLFGDDFFTGYYVKDTITISGTDGPINGAIVLSDILKGQIELGEFSKAMISRGRGVALISGITEKRWDTEYVHDFANNSFSEVVEWIGYESCVYDDQTGLHILNGVYRGLFGSRKVPFTSNRSVWFPAEANIVTSAGYIPEYNRDLDGVQPRYFVKISGTGHAGTRRFSSATTSKLDSNLPRPLNAPSDIHIIDALDGARYNDGEFFPEVDPVIRWSHNPRNANVVFQGDKTNKSDPELYGFEVDAWGLVAGEWVLLIDSLEVPASQADTGIEGIRRTTYEISVDEVAVLGERATSIAVSIGALPLKSAWGIGGVDGWFGFPIANGQGPITVHRQPA